MTKHWAITKDLFLNRTEVLRLYSSLKDIRDLALLRKTFYCNVRDYYILRVLLETGVRVFELIAFKTSDFRSGSLIVRSGKGGKARSILLTKESQRLLKEWIVIKAESINEPTGPEDFLFLSERGNAYSTRGIRKRVKLCFARIGLSESLSCHSCRHTYITHMLANGVDLITVRDNAGHSSLAITSIYAHSVKDDLGELNLYSSVLT